MSRGQGRLYRQAHSDVWWLDYSVRGKRHRESSGCTRRGDAADLLRERIGHRKVGTLVGQPDKVTFAMLRELAERQYANDGRRSLDRLQDAMNRLGEFFGTKDDTGDHSDRVVDITPSRIDAYAERRLKAGRKRSSVNFELACLRRAFRIAIKNGLLAAMPTFELPKPRNRRTGFFEEGDFAALVLELSPALRPLIQFLWFTGWRRDEARLLTWAQVDREAQELRIDGARTKSGEPRVFPYGNAPALRELIEARWAARDGVLVFHDGGRPVGVGKLRSGWTRACVRAGLATVDPATKKVTLHRIVHDLRRSAARNLRRAGLSESDIMELCGWETREMFKRYCITDVRALGAAVAKAYAPAPAPAPTGIQRAYNEGVDGEGDPLSSSAT